MKFWKALNSLICGAPTEPAPEARVGSQRETVEKDTLSIHGPIRRVWTTGSPAIVRTARKPAPPRSQTFSVQPRWPNRRKQSLPQISFLSRLRGNMAQKKSLLEQLRIAEVDIAGRDGGVAYSLVPISSIDKIFKNPDDVVKELKLIIEASDDMKSMKSFIFNEAKRLVSLLIRRNCLPWLDIFHRERFGDDCFPVKLKHPEYDADDPEWTIQSYKSDRNISLRPEMGRDTGSFKDALKAFCEREQWEFFVPVFKPDDAAHVFHDQCRMPYLKEGTMVDKKSNPHIAVKELVSAQYLNSEQFQDLVKNEATVLTRLRDLKHPHFIRAIATYTKGDRHYFVFPWARGGNLRDFWSKQPSLSSASERFSSQDCDDYFKWFFQQLYGLAGALKELHHPKQNIQESCRHGDLKPENILCFSGTDIGTSKVPIGVRLVVADAGHAKVHEKATEFRPGPTSTPKGTTMYSPPEAETQLKEARTRRYDIWSLGCLYLESLTWMMYGYDALKTFHKDIVSNEHYYSKNSGSIDLKESVKEWINVIKHDPRSKPLGKTAIGRLVSLIEKRLLIVRATTRRKSLTHDFDPEQSTTDSPPKGPNDGIKMLVQRPTLDPAAFSAMESGAPLNENPERADAREVYEEMKKIFEAVEEGQDLIWMNKDGIAKAAQRGLPTLTPSLAPDGTERSLLKSNPAEYRTDLNNVWNYAVDDEMARAVVLDSTERQQNHEYSTLCRRCQDRKIWSEKCEFTETLIGLEDRSKSCDLCRLLHSVMHRRAARRSEPIKFMRAGSYLTFGQKDWGPILSLCHSGDSKALNDNNIQPGFPLPLIPGGKTHLQILAKWIKSCDSTRHLPERSGFVPTRLLSVGDDRSTRVRLVSDFGKENPPVLYVALSHQWGVDTMVAGKFATTTIDNIRLISAKEGVEDASLPQTFRDAVIITRKLGVKYLWIDSLCILQKNGREQDPDSKKDWDKESQLMENIFGSAYLTIAASCASNRFEGFLTPRPPRKFVTMRGDDGAQFHVCEIIDKFETDVEKGELNQRGWVLQERALSQRTLHFTSNQTYWECGDGIRCETFTKAVNNISAFLNDSNFPHSVESFKDGKKLQYYQYLYELYSSLKLTYKTDRPQAIAGLEQRLMRALDSTGGYGVIRTNFHRDLLWQRRNTGTTLQRIVFPAGKDVPSWSWMAFDGEIRFMNVPLGDLKRRLRPEDEDILSPFPESWDNNPEGTRRISEQAYFRAHAHTLLNDNPAQMILDEPDRNLTRPLKCVIIGSNRQEKGEPLRYYALIVAPVEGLEKKEVFERVGVSYLSKEDVSIEEKTKYVNVG
ncbi:heterokaryon incompatibility protein [Colletotrichum fioriniae PJ7]|uniref:Heterokaryon incompatibility protein n=1 Tax=Colletotrichum fioriniae PJ7 TaxID=1445577 RepID=A0A010Q5J7_9PEZI|nr:heterokaryon incompatibility protein [Colletotrichum fioriniae PJ7]